MDYFLFLREFWNPLSGRCCAAENVAAPCDHRSLNASLVTDRRMLKRHRRLVRTGLSTCIAYLIREAARRRATDFIGLETVVPGRKDQRAVAVNIDLARSRAAPRQVRSPFPTY